MNWLEVIGIANFIVLCIIAVGVYRATHAVASMHSGLAQVLVRQEEIGKKILWQFDSGLPDEGKSLRKFPLHILVHTILEDFRSFTQKWFMLHVRGFAEMEIRDKGPKAIYEELKADFPDVLGDDPAFDKLFGDEEDNSEEDR